MPIVQNQVCNAPGKSDCGFNGHWRPFVSRLRLDYCHQSLYLQYTSNLLKNIICLIDRTRVPSLSNLVNQKIQKFRKSKTIEKPSNAMVPPEKNTTIASPQKFDHCSSLESNMKHSRTLSSQDGPYGIMMKTN